jgi:hypothetical protein
VVKLKDLTKTNISDISDIKDYVEEIYVVRDEDTDGALQPIISGNLVIKTKSGKTYKVGIKDL